MTESEKNLTDGNLTQKEIIQLLLHNAQHMATREEVKSDIKELREEVKADIKELREEVKSDIKELREEVKSDIKELKEDVLRIETSLKQDISKVDAKFDKIQWLIIATIVTILSKDYLFNLLESSSK